MINFDKFKMGYFILWRNEGGFVGDVIENTQKSFGFSDEDSKYVHIDVSGGGMFAVRVNPPRTKVVDIKKVYRGRHFKVVRYNNNIYEGGKRYKVAFWAASNCNKRYALWDLLRFKIPFLKQNKDLYFCSENALWALQQDFPEALNFLAPEDCMPADFLDENYFKCVYEGVC